VGIVRTDFFEDGQPIHFGHAKIKNGHARGVLTEEGQAFDPTRRRQHLIPMPGENGLDQLAVHAIVVNHENFDHASASPAEMRRASIILKFSVT
jgi:hypothetical protein